MKILHIISGTDPREGGPVECVRQLDVELGRHGVVQEVLSLDPPGDPAALGFPCKVHALGNPAVAGTGLLHRIRRWARYAPQAREWAKAHVADYDAVIVNGLWNYSTRVAKLALAGGSVPYVVYSHGMLDPWFRKRYPAKHAIKQVLWWINEGVLLRRANAVLFTCEQERMLARQTFVPYRVNERVVAFGTSAPPPPAPDQIPAFRAMIPALGDRRYLLFFGRIHEKKGCDLLVDAFAATAGLDPALDLVIAGPDDTGWRPALEARAKELGVAERIHWPGMVTGPAKWGALRGAEAFVLPSHQENFGIAVAEALACRCPVLISNQVNIWREIAEADAGLTQTDDLAGTIALLRGWNATDESAREAMRVAGEALFKRQFTIEAGARELLEVLRKITYKAK